jgi:hypothetical protein
MLRDLGLGLTVTTQVLYHPSDRVDKSFQFNYDRFLCNTNKKVIQVGGWLRNSYAIYELPKPKDFEKNVLKWKGMENYFITENDLQKIECCVLNIGTNDDEHCCGNPTNVMSCPPNVMSCPPPSENCCGNIANTQMTNKYIVGLVKMIHQNHISVKCLEMVPNEKYDLLLTENVIFINLLDASAVNTIIECIMRNTPICVNRLPAVEEYLGVNYPLYYTTLAEASEKIGNVHTIKHAHDYLKHLDKTKFTIEHFLTDLTKADFYEDL